MAHALKPLTAAVSLKIGHKSVAVTAVTETGTGKRR